MFNPPICLIFVIRIRLTIFLAPILFLLCDYTRTIDSSVRNVFNICSAMFRVRCTSFWFLMTTINIISHVSVCGTSLFYLIILYLHNILSYCFLYLLLRTRMHMLNSIVVCRIHTYEYNHHVTFPYFQTFSKYFPLPYYHTHSISLYFHFFWSHIIFMFMLSNSSCWTFSLTYLIISVTCPFFCWHPI